MDSIIGCKFGKLTAIEYILIGTRHYYRCGCECGGYKDVLKTNLLSGRVKSCGCMTREDLTGNVYGYLTVLRESSKRDSERRRLWECECECGNIVLKSTKSLKDGECKSCGCKTTELRIASGNVIKHNMSGTRLYRIWAEMKNRCSDSDTPAYKDYGGRGISVCSEWQEFEPFMKWASDSGYSDSLTIDRIDVNGNYCPSNCRWVNRIVQANNKRTSRYVEYRNEKHTISEWSKLMGINKATIRCRINAGWSVEEALFLPPKPGGAKRIQDNGA